MPAVLPIAAGTSGALVLRNLRYFANFSAMPPPRMMRSGHR
jgi:hypothetical protein